MDSGRNSQRVSAYQRPDGRLDRPAEVGILKVVTRCARLLDETSSAVFISDKASFAESVLHALVRRECSAIKNEI